MRALFLFLFSVSVCTGFASPKDSTGTKVVNGRVYILHKVTQKETAYSISKAYKIALDSLYASNGNNKKIKVGMVLLIPTQQVLVSDSEKLNAAHANADAQAGVVVTKHRVMKGETIQKIALKYGITVADIQKWNALRDTRIDIGQYLVVNALGALSPFKAWNKPLSEPLVDSTALYSIQPSQVDELMEQGKPILDPTVKVSRIRFVPSGGVVQITNLASGKQLLIPAEGGLQSLDPEIVIELTREDANELEISGDEKSPVLIRYYLPSP